MLKVWIRDRRRLDKRSKREARLQEGRASIRQELRPSQSLDPALVSWMEMIEAGTHAHGVMPRGGERPPHQCAENTLADGEGKNVSLPSEEPGHRDSTDPGERNENWIRPMERGKDRASHQRRQHGAIQCGEKAIG